MDRKVSADVFFYHQENDWKASLYFDRKFEFDFTHSDPIGALRGIQEYLLGFLCTVVVRIIEYHHCKVPFSFGDT